MLMQPMANVGEVSLDAGFGSFTVVDVETSGLRAAQHRVLSVAALTLDTAGRVTREFHTLLDPGCDPGPVHIHGLTREVLRGAPAFAEVREELSELLTGRVMVAHNARFDYGFLAREFDLTGDVLPVSRRLCTLALARRVCLPVPDCKLATLASYYGIAQTRAHDALDDTRVLAGVLRALVADAARLGVAPPMLACPPKENYRETWNRGSSRTGPKQPCLYTYPGRLGAGEPLVQGMKIAFTGETSVDREILVAEAEAAGLDVTGAVSKLTSALVTNTPRSGTGKARRAVEYATPVLTERQFRTLLEKVRPGRRTDDPAAAAQRGRENRADPPLSGRRFLVLGGSHAQAAAIRARIGELGGSAAVNMSARVTDVLTLPGAESDHRLAKAVELGLPVHGPELLALASAPPLPESSPSRGQDGEPCVATPVEPPRPFAVSDPTPPTVLGPGHVMDLPTAVHGDTWTVRASWVQGRNWEVDVVAFLLDGDEKVSGDDDFVFYNQPETVGIRLNADGPSEQSVDVSLDRLPDHCVRVVFAAALDGAGVTFGDIGAVEIEFAPGPDVGTVARATLDAATEERTLLLAEIYVRGDNWRLRAFGQGYTDGLAALARGYGVDVAG